MATKHKHIHIWVHKHATHDAGAAHDPAEVQKLVDLLHEVLGKQGTQDAGKFDESKHPRDPDGKFTEGAGSAPKGPKPTSTVAKSSKAATHELLSTGHPFSIDELMAATGINKVITLKTAIADLKNPKYAHKGVALDIVKLPNGMYQVQQKAGAALAQANAAAEQVAKAAVAKAEPAAAEVSIPKPTKAAPTAPSTTKTYQHPLDMLDACAPSQNGGKFNASKANVALDWYMEQQAAKLSAGGADGDLPAHAKAALWKEKVADFHAEMMSVATGISHKASPQAPDANDLGLMTALDAAKTPEAQAKALEDWKNCKFFPKEELQAANAKTNTEAQKVEAALPKPSASSNPPPKEPDLDPATGMLSDAAHAKAQNELAAHLTKWAEKLWEDYGDEPVDEDDESPLYSALNAQYNKQLKAGTESALAAHSPDPKLLKNVALPSDAQFMTGKDLPSDGVLMATQTLLSDLALAGDKSEIAPTIKAFVEEQGLIPKKIKAPSAAPATAPASTSTASHITLTPEQQAAIHKSVATAMAKWAATKYENHEDAGLEEPNKALWDTIKKDGVGALQKAWQQAAKEHGVGKGALPDLSTSLAPHAKTALADMMYAHDTPGAFAKAFKLWQQKHWNPGDTLPLKAAPAPTPPATPAGILSTAEHAKAQNTVKEHVAKWAQQVWEKHGGKSGSIDPDEIDETVGTAALAAVNGGLKKALEAHQPDVPYLYNVANLQDDDGEIMGAHVALSAALADATTPEEVKTAAHEFIDNLNPVPAAVKKSALAAVAPKASPIAPKAAPGKALPHPKGFKHIGEHDLGPGNETLSNEGNTGHKALTKDGQDAVQNKIKVQAALNKRLKEHPHFQRWAEKLKAGSGADLTRKLVAAWAASSGGWRSTSCAVQLAAAEEFDMPTGTYTTTPFNALHKSAGGDPRKLLRNAMADLALGAAEHHTEEDVDSFHQALRGFVRAQYDETQDYFKKKGITSLTLARGMNNLQEGVHSQDGLVKLHLQPLSSFSTSPSTATDFATGDPTTASVYYARVPVEKVVGTYHTGNGCTGEYEVVVAAHPELTAYQTQAYGAPKMWDGVNHHIGKSIAKAKALKGE